MMFVIPMDPSVTSVPNVMTLPVRMKNHSLVDHALFAAILVLLVSSAMNVGLTVGFMSRLRLSPVNHPLLVLPLPKTLLAYSNKFLVISLPRPLVLQLLRLQRKHSGLLIVMMLLSLLL